MLHLKPRSGCSLLFASPQQTSRVWMAEPGWASPAPSDEKPDWLTRPPAAAETTRSTADVPSAPDEEWVSESGSRVQRASAPTASFSLQDLTLNFFQPLCTSEPILRKVAFVGFRRGFSFICAYYYKKLTLFSFSLFFLK